MKVLLVTSLLLGLFAERANGQVYSAYPPSRYTNRPGYYGSRYVRNLPYYPGDLYRYRRPLVVLVGVSQTPSPVTPQLPSLVDRSGGWVDAEVAREKNRETALQWIKEEISRVKAKEDSVKKRVKNNALD